MENVRNLGEMGINLQKIVTRLTNNQNLLKLLYYTDKDPLSNPDLTDDDIQNKIFEQLIKVVPRVGPKETAKSLVSMRVVRGRINPANNQFTDISLGIEIFVPLTQWIIKDSNLRPFAIMGEILKSLNNKKINGIGRLVGGDFDINFLTEEISCYEMVFNLIQYE